MPRPLHRRGSWSVTAAPTRWRATPAPPALRAAHARGAAGAALGSRDAAERWQWAKRRCCIARQQALLPQPTSALLRGCASADARVAVQLPGRRCALPVTSSLVRCFSACAITALVISSTLPSWSLHVAGEGKPRSGRGVRANAGSAARAARMLCGARCLQNRASPCLRCGGVAGPPKPAGPTKPVLPLVCMADRCRAGICTSSSGALGRLLANPTVQPPGSASLVCLAHRRGHSVHVGDVPQPV